MEQNRRNRSQAEPAAEQLALLLTAFCILAISLYTRQTIAATQYLIFITGVQARVPPWCTRFPTSAGGFVCSGLIGHGNVLLH
jgi:hypothetical protein